MSELVIKDLAVSVEGRVILKNINLVIKQGEIHALMGPNAAGKTTLGYALMGHPKYKIEKGEILLDGENIVGLSADKIARLGIFLGFQHPITVTGVTVSNFLWEAYKSLKSSNGETPVSREQFQDILRESLELLNLDRNLIERYVNDGFSGGEKKKSEILQLLVLQPKFAILDEPDSGIDIDSLRLISKAINIAVEKHNIGVLLITHYNRILYHVKPHLVHVMIDGEIKKTGGAELAHEIEAKGYQGGE